MSFTQEGGAVLLDVEETPGRQKQQLLLAVVVLFLFREGRLREVKWLLGIIIIHSVSHNILNPYCMLSTVLGPWNQFMNNTSKDPPTNEA